MEVNFATKKLADTLSQDKLRVRTYGDAVAKSLRTRLIELAAAQTLEDMANAPGGCHELREDRKGELAVTLTRNLRLIFKPTDDPPPSKSDGGLDRQAVTAVTVLEVKDYHGR